MPAYDNPSGIIAAAIVLQLIATTAVALRFYSTYKKKPPWEASEWLILGAWFSSLSLVGMEIYGKLIQFLFLAHNDVK